MLRNEIYRIIDANVNRASEALRVLEDWARFSSQQTVDSGQILNLKLKKIRHDLNNILLLHPNLIMNRESIHDAGRNIENNSERKSIKDIIRANCKRVEESFRVLSEYGQIVETLQENVSMFENNRYEIYTIEKALIKNEKLLRLYNARLYLVAGRDAPVGRLNDKEFLSVIEKSVEGGVDIIQLREKNESESKILQLANDIKKMICGTDVLFIINDRVDLALAADADGVHLGQDDFPINEARKICPEGFIIGLSTHNLEQGGNAVKGPADYLGVGPVFQTPTKPDYKVAGLDYVQWASKNIVNKPWFAIGGIDETNIDKVINNGAGKVAVVRAIMNSSDSEKAAKSLKERLLNNQYAKTK